MAMAVQIEEIYAKDGMVPHGYALAIRAMPVNLNKFLREGYMVFFSRAKMGTKLI